jgi:hypothetical protein
MYFIEVTLDVSNLRGLLKRLQVLNILSIEVTLDVSQLRGLLKRPQLLNILYIEVTLLTSQASIVELK